MKRTMVGKGKKSQGVSIKKRGALFGYLFTAHWLLGFLVFTLYPLVRSLLMSAQRVTIGAVGIEGEYIGFANYSYAFTLDLRFLTAMVETVRSIGILTPLIIILAMIITLLLERARKLKGIFRALYFLPVIIISGQLMSLLEANAVFDIVNPEDETIFIWLANSGLSVVPEIITFLITNIFTVLWFTGVQILIYLSGMQKISRTVYEAAAIDGASGWQVFWKITLPSLGQFTAINVVYTVVALATFPTNPVIIHIKQVMFRMDAFAGLGYASALSWSFFVLVLVMLYLILLLSGFRFKEKKRTLR